MRIFLIAALLSCFLSQAQINFEKGYFIGNNGERKECFIENLDWSNNPTYFNYKINENGTEKLIGNIGGVSEFSIYGKSKFVRHTVNMEKSDPNDLNHLGHSKKPVLESETLYLKFLIQGSANLYSYKNSNITKYFFETDNTSLEQLIYFKYFGDDPANPGIVKENNQFRQQLFNHVRCENEKEDDFRTISFNKNELIKIFEKYNLCHKKETIQNVNYDSKIKRKHFALKITSGIYTAKFSSSGAIHFYDVNTEQNKIAVKLALDAEYILPFNNGAWTLVLNPGYHKFSDTKNFTQDNGYGNDVNYTVTTNYSAIEIPVGLRRYFYLSPSSKIFINGMYVASFPISDSKINFDNQSYGPNGKGTYALESSTHVAIGAGYSYKRFSAELRLNTPSNLVEIQNQRLSLKYKTLGVNFGYSIF